MIFVPRTSIPGAFAPNPTKLGIPINPPPIDVNVIGVPEEKGIIAPFPVAPVGPVAPVAPVGPISPWGPVGPISPWGPVGPISPWGPVGPISP